MKKKLAGKALALLMMLCVLCMGMTVSAAPTDNETNGNITLTATEGMEGIKVGLFEVGALSDENQYRLYDSYQESGVDVTALKESSDVEAAAVLLSEIALKQEPLQQTAFGADGKLVFASLSTADKLYLICQLETNEQYTLSPILANLPQFLDGQVLTDIQIEAKYEFVPPEEPKGAIILNKTDENDHALAGAEFNLCEKAYMEGAYAIQGMKTETDSNGTYIWREIGTFTTDQAGQITVVDVPFGTYRFVETKAPAGYLLDSAPVYAEVAEEGTIRLEKGVYVADNGKPVILTVKNKPIPVEESSQVSIPSSTPEIPPEPSVPPVVTGEDIAKFVIIGVVVGVSLIAVILLFVLGRKKKDKSQQDQ